MSSSEEDFSLVMEPKPGGTLEDIQGLISYNKRRYQQLMDEQKELAACRDESRELAEQFRRRCRKLAQQTEEDEAAHGQRMADEQVKLNRLQLEESELMEELKKMEAELRGKKAQNDHLRQQMDVFAAVPRRKLVFRGETADPGATSAFEMKPQVVYPMDGGTALITFEEEIVAKKILALRRHRVDLGGDVIVQVEARPVHLMLPRLVEINTDVCPRRILISDLPGMDADTLLNKLEIHFSKTKNGGGEVDDCELLPDSGSVVVTFVDETIAKGLTLIEFHDVTLQKKKHRVRVTPFLNGTISNFKTRLAACPRTVLLTGIPDIMERENLQDLLEIHFQKNSNGGGEIEAFLYNPLGQTTAALFGGADSPGAAGGGGGE